METAILISGFGGQGVLSAGELLARAALIAGMETTCFPSYGPEMRGGTAHCSVVISDKAICSPLVRNPHAVILMNLPSLDKYENTVRKDGLIVVDSSMTRRDVTRSDVCVVAVPATSIAESLGSKKVANVVLVGAFVKARGIVPFEELRAALESLLAGKHPEMLELNKKALVAGAEFI